MIKNQFGVNIKRLRSDNGKEYFNHVLTSFCQKEGIVYESSCVKTPQQNGITERKNGHLLYQTRALLFHQNVPKYLCGEVVLTSTYLINRLPSKILGFKSPMDVLSSFYPNLPVSSNLKPRIFGCVSFVHVHSQERKKLDPRALRCVFVGYSSTQKGYKCFHPTSKKFFVSRDVIFHEEEPYFTQPYLHEENFKEDKLESLDLSGLESNALNLSSIKSNASSHSGHNSNTLDLSHFGHDSNTLNLSGLESNPPNSSSFESNKPNLFGLELNTLAPNPYEAEEVGVESNQLNTPVAKLGLKWI